MNRKVEWKTDRKLGEKISYAIELSPQSLFRSLTSPIWSDWRWNCDASEVGDVERFFHLAFVSLSISFLLLSTATLPLLQKVDGRDVTMVEAICWVPRSTNHVSHTKETEFILFWVIFPTPKKQKVTFWCQFYTVNPRRVAVQRKSYRTHFWPNQIRTTNWENR